jgi:glucokinase
MAEHFAGIDAGFNPPVMRAVILDGAGAIVRRQDGVEFDASDAVSLGIAMDTPVATTTEGALDPRAVPAGAPPVVVSPGAAAVTAEVWVGAARGARHAICLMIGERVLAGILLDGKPWAGAHDRAGATAWLAMNPVERQDYRKYGSLAAEVSSKGIARRLSWRIQAGDHSAVLEKAGDLESITAAHVFDGARNGDGVSISVVRDTAKYIGMAVANLAVIIDPEVIVLSGAVAAAGDLLLDPARQEFARRVPPGMAEQVRLHTSPLGDYGIAIGAARLAMLARP